MAIAEDPDIEESVRLLSQLGINVPQGQVGGAGLPLPSDPNSMMVEAHLQHSVMLLPGYERAMPGGTTGEQLVGLFIAALFPTTEVRGRGALGSNASVLQWYEGRVASYDGGSELYELVFEVDGGREFVRLPDIRVIFKTQRASTNRIPTSTAANKCRACGICQVVGHDRRNCPQRPLA